jgi:hypothetical protein
MARPQNDEEYGDKLADDRAVNVRVGNNLRNLLDGCGSNVVKERIVHFRK